VQLRYFGGANLDSIHQQQHFRMANLPSAQAAKGWIMLSFHDCPAEFSANLDSNDFGTKCFVPLQ
jgi:hypothetical protein